MSKFGRFQVLHTKFDNNTTKELLMLLADVDWGQPVSAICEQLLAYSQHRFQNRIMWIVGTNPSYFIQYQIDCYAIFKGYDKVMLAWKPKYLEYPAISKLSDFGESPKIMKSMKVSVQQKSQSIPSSVADKISQYLMLYYSKYYFTAQQATFQKNMLSQLKNYISRIDKHSYWHCTIDTHNGIDFAAPKDCYIRFRITGIKEDYDRDFVLCSQKGVREFILKGKMGQAVSFLAMVIIFLCVVGCNVAEPTGYCQYKDEMILGSSGIMLALMGMKVVSRNQYKKKLDRKIAKLQSLSSEQKKQ